jgi:hypothetical protein
VLFITTLFQGDKRTNKKRKMQSTDHLRARPIQLEFGKETTKFVPIRTAAATYDDEMNHADRGDQLSQ